MLDEKKLVDKLTEIVGLMKNLRMDFFDSFPEDAIEERTSWSKLYEIASDDYYTSKSVKDALEKLLDDIEYWVYEKE